jgi:hypothetical protein
MALLAYNPKNNLKKNTRTLEIEKKKQKTIRDIQNTIISFRKINFMRMGEYKSICPERNFVIDSK